MQLAILVANLFLIILVIIAVIVAIMGAIFPAWQAGRIAPAESLRYTG